MKIVGDEGVPRALVRRLRVIGIDIAPPPREWRGLSNGRLITAVAGAGFQGLLSNDKNLVFQLNLAELAIAIVGLPTNRRQSIVPRAEDLADTLGRVKPGQHTAIELDGRRTLRRSASGGAILAEALPSIAPFDP